MGAPTGTLWRFRPKPKEVGHHDLRADPDSPALYKSLFGLQSSNSGLNSELSRRPDVLSLPPLGIHQWSNYLSNLARFHLCATIQSGIGESPFAALSSTDGLQGGFE